MGAGWVERQMTEKAAWRMRVLKEGGHDVDRASAVFTLIKGGMVFTV